MRKRIDDVAHFPCLSYASVDSKQVVVCFWVGFLRLEILVDEVPEKKEVLNRVDEIYNGFCVTLRARKSQLHRHPLTEFLGYES